MSKVLYIRNLPDDAYYKLKGWQAKFRTHRWVDFFEKIDDVLTEWEQLKRQSGSDESIKTSIHEDDLSGDE